MQRGQLQIAPDLQTAVGTALNERSGNGLASGRDRDVVKIVS